MGPDPRSLVPLLVPVRCWHTPVTPIPRPLPVSLVHAHGRNVPHHVRVVMNWLADSLEEQLD